MTSGHNQYWVCCQVIPGYYYSTITYTDDISAFLLFYKLKHGWRMGKNRRREVTREPKKRSYTRLIVLTCYEMSQKHTRDVRCRKQHFRWTAIQITTYERNNHRLLHRLKKLYPGTQQNFELRFLLADVICEQPQYTPINA